MKKAISILTVKISLTLFLLSCVASIPKSYADVTVVSTAPVYRTVVSQVCEVQDVIVERSTAGGTLIGGILGGLAGHQVGGGNGRTAATILGTVAGASVGRNIADKNPKVEQRRICKDVTTQELAGESVTFNYNGKIFTREFSE